jgi:hypothetical protein
VLASLPRTVERRWRNNEVVGSDVRDVLGRWLGADTRALDVLSDEELEQLHTMLEAARKRQAEALAAASEEALRQMPAVLRGSVRMVLGR